MDYPPVPRRRESIIAATEKKVNEEECGGEIQAFPRFFHNEHQEVGSNNM
jgi:hypothetical protein